MNQDLKDLAALAYEQKVKQHPLVLVHAIPQASYTDKTANGLTKCIIDYLNLNGWYAVRINTQGQYNPKLKKWTKGTTSRGTGDIHATVNGRHISIEIKIGKDRLSDHQKQTQERIEKAGGLYFVAKDYSGFIRWLNSVLAERSGHEEKD